MLSLASSGELWSVERVIELIKFVELNLDRMILLILVSRYGFSSFMNPQALDCIMLFYLKRFKLYMKQNTLMSL